jgi:hypothetical protein
MVTIFPVMEQQSLMGPANVLLPGVFVLFYRSPHVKATCEHKDPNVPWTDRCPAPVLAASLLTGFGALCYLSLALSYRAIAFFGLLKGLPAIAVSLVLAGIHAFAAVDLYRQRLRGWWVVVITAIVLMFSGIVSFLNVDVPAWYEAMGYPRDMVEGLAPLMISIRWMMVAWAPLWLGFFLWVKRYLGTAAPRA